MNELRLLIAEWLIEKAISIMPKGSKEQLLMITLFLTYFSKIKLKKRM